MKLLRCFTVIGMLLPAVGIGAQGRPEVRADAVVSDKIAVYAGAGILFPLGTYLRSGVVAALGTAGSGASYRVEMVNLFHADPFRESRWGPYGGGGISYRRDRDDRRGNARIFAILGAEGPAKRGYYPSLEIGLGGGVRAGIVLRKSRERTR